MGNPYAVLKEYEGQYLKYPRLCEIIGEEKKISGHLKSRTLIASKSMLTSHKTRVRFTLDVSMTAMTSYKL